MTFAASSLAICLAVSLLCAAGCNASPLMAGDSSNQAHVAFELLSNAMKQSANALALVQEATIYTMAKHETSFNFFHSAATRPDRRLQQQEQSCPASQTASCTSQIERPNLRSCMFALFKAAAGNPLNSPFAFPSLLCQLASTNSSCASDLIGYFKTCTCVDFQPLYNLACPSAPTASACSRNSFVKRFLALNAQNSSLGFFGETMMQFPFPQTGVRPDLAPCGNADAYRQTVLINGLGPCLYSIIDAFPLPTFVLSQTVTNTSLNMGQMIRDGMRCALTAPSYRYQTYCSGNIAKCFSLRQTPDFDLCRGATASSCPAGCRDKLAAYGASSSSSPAKCCVKWFQQQAKAEQCSDAAAVSVASFMGPECMGFVRTQLSNAPPQPGQPRMSPEMLNALFNAPILPGQCAARSPAALAVDNCAVPDAGLAPSCPDDSTPYVRASLFAPKQTSTATITFSSSSLKAVSAPLYSFFSNRSPVPLSSSGRPLLTFPAQVLATKYSQTLEAVQKALESRLQPGTVVEPLSVTAPFIGSRRLLQSSSTIIATAAITTTAQMPSTANPQSAINAITATDLQSSLTTQLSALVDPAVSAGTVQTISASTAEDAPQPQALPAQPATDAPPSKNSALAAHLQPLLLLLLAAFLF